MNFNRYPFAHESAEFRLGNRSNARGLLVDVALYFVSLMVFKGWAIGKYEYNRLFQLLKVNWCCWFTNDTKVRVNNRVRLG